MYLLWVVYRGEYTPFMDELTKNFLKVHNRYPTMVSEAYSILLHYMNDTTAYSRKIKDMY